MLFPAFGENLIVSANPSRSGGDWWYGTLIGTGKAGFFPKIYVQTLDHGEYLLHFLLLLTNSFSVKAKALYSYTSGSADELSFVEGDTLDIIDRSEGDWWKTEKDGVVFIVPAAYLEVVEG